jgi:hypothetical protein
LNELADASGKAAVERELSSPRKYANVRGRQLATTLNQIDFKHLTALGDALDERALWQRVDKNSKSKCV